MLLVRVSIASIKYHDQDNSNKEKHLLNELSCSFRGPVYYPHGEKHDQQAEMVLEKELRILHIDPQATEGDCTSMA